MEHNQFIDELSWREAINEISNVNPGLAEIIQTVLPDNDFSLIKVRYPYGAKIINQGVLQLPMNNGAMLPCHHNGVSPSLREKLAYCFKPLGLILKNSAEVYFSTNLRIVPKKLYSTGEIFGLWQLLDLPDANYLKHIWNMSSGARTIFMLPMISDNVNHARLRRELSIHSYPPKSLQDQHDVFTEIVQHSSTNKSWLCEILFFTHRWFDNTIDKSRYMPLWNYWLSQAWQQSHHCRRSMILDVAQETFSETISRRNLKPKPYILNTLNHLLDIGRGIFPGFVSAGLSEQVAPIRLLQDAYVNSYLLKDYAPIIMYPNHLNAKTGIHKVYYSLSFPTLLNQGPRPGRMPSLMADLRELKLLFNVAQEFYQDLAVDYKFFHSELDQFGEIYHSQDLPQYDENLLVYPKDYAKRSFPYTGQFMRGCIQLNVP